jgi:hypothetical protein
LTLVACAAGPVLPRYTQSSKYDKVELIAYRALTRDDFRAEVAVGFTIVEEHRVSATTCARISLHRRLPQARVCHR